MAKRNSDASELAELLGETVVDAHELDSSDSEGVDGDAEPASNAESGEGGATPAVAATSGKGWVSGWQ